MNDKRELQTLYPDVLSAIAGGMRINMGSLHIAVGVFPRSVYLNQPVEIVLILQNMVDQNMEVKIALQLPSLDNARKAVVIATPRKSLTLGLKPAEVGVLRLPLVPLPPTQPGSDLPVGIAVRHRTSKPGRSVRVPVGGVPPSVLAVSPFKLQALRDVDFAQYPSNRSPENLTVYFDIAPKKLPSAPQNLKPSYEPLWTQAQMVEERQFVRSKIDEAIQIAREFSRNQLHVPLTRVVDDVYSSLGLPLHPGEAKAVAKMLAYTLDNSISVDWASNLEELRWFQTLCQVIAYDETIGSWDSSALVARYLFEAALYDAVVQGFNLLRSYTQVNLGDRTEWINYANRLLGWLGGQGEPDLAYIYLPLALGGVVVNHTVTGRNEDRWVMLEELREAYRGRVRLVTGDVTIIFDMLDELLTRAEEDLRRLRVPRI